MPEPSVKRTVAFFDGQNLYHSAREAFGYTYPNYDIFARANCICAEKGWLFDHARFYTGIPDKMDNKIWHDFWEKKLLALSRQGVVTFSRQLRYRNKRVTLPDGTKHSFLTGQEKGVDVRIALDVIRLARQNAYDIALVFSEDQDFSEVAKEIRIIAKEQNRWIRIASAYPHSPTHRGYKIHQTEGIPIDRQTFDKCIASYPPDPTLKKL
jgi:uncharacterized LabA/DUF88 family protein